MKFESHRDLRVLEALAADGRTTQRRLAEHLGIALGLANLYLKRMVRKGFIKCTNVRANRVRYLLTPTGIAEKTRLTYEFMEYSLRLYRESRQNLRKILQPCAANPSTRVAIYGTGEAAELAYLCLKELGLETVAIFDGGPGGSFLGVPVTSVTDCQSVDFDLLIIASMDRNDSIMQRLEASGIPRQKIVSLRQEVSDAS